VVLGQALEIGEAQLRASHRASHREMSPQGSPNQLVQNVTVCFSTKFPQIFLS